MIGSFPYTVSEPIGRAPASAYSQAFIGDFLLENNVSAVEQQPMSTCIFLAYPPTIHSLNTTFSFNSLCLSNNSGIHPPITNSTLSHLSFIIAHASITFSKSFSDRLPPAQPIETGPALPIQRALTNLFTSIALFTTNT